MILWIFIKIRSFSDVKNRLSFFSDGKLLNFNKIKVSQIGDFLLLYWIQHASFFLNINYRTQRSYKNFISVITLQNNNGSIYFTNS